MLLMLAQKKVDEPADGDAHKNSQQVDGDAAKTAEMENDLEEDPRQIAAKTAEMESDLWKERLRVREIAETTAEIAEKTAEMKKTAQNLRETDRRAHKAEGPKPKRIHSEPVKPQSVWSLVSAGPPQVLFWPPAEVLPGKRCSPRQKEGK